MYALAAEINLRVWKTEQQMPVDAKVVMSSGLCLAWVKASSYSNHEVIVILLRSTLIVCSVIQLDYG